MRSLIFSKILYLFWLVFFSCSLSAKEDTPQQIQGATRIQAETLLELVETKSDLVIIDARKAQDREAGYIESAILLTNTDMTETVLANIVPNKSTPLVFYCNGTKCGRSVDASKKAIGWGYTEIYWFRGGWEEWSQKGLPYVLEKCNESSGAI